MSKKDILIAVAVGFIAGLIWTAVFIWLGTFDFLELGNRIWGFAIVVPIIFVFGLYLGRILSAIRPFFYSFAKFIIIGFLNTGIDFSVFNLLIYLTGILEGVGITIFKAAGFIFAFTNSYFWNKHWTYQAGNTTQNTGEFFKFGLVTLIGLLLNVGITSLVVFLVPPQFGFGQLAWNNIAAAAAVIANLIWNFIGYKIFVFRK